jgi:hypothetical protein
MTARTAPTSCGPVGQQDRVAGPDIVGKGGVAGEEMIGRPDVVAGREIGGDDDRAPAGQDDGAAGDPADPQLGALEVGEHADGPPRGVRGDPDVGVGLGVEGVIAVGEVESGDIHARRHEVGHPGGRSGRRPDGADDLRSPGHVQGDGVVDRWSQQRLGHRRSPVA